MCVWCRHTQEDQLRGDADEDQEAEESVVTADEVKERLEDWPVLDIIRNDAPSSVRTWTADEVRVVVSSSCPRGGA